MCSLVSNSKIIVNSSPSVVSDARNRTKSLSSLDSPTSMAAAHLQRERTASEPTLKLPERKITVIDSTPSKMPGRIEKIQKAFDNFALSIQMSFDALCQSIVTKLLKIQGVEKFHQWLEKADARWYEQLAQFLIKMPPRIAKNILGLVLGIIAAVLYTPVHPQKAFRAFIALLKKLVTELAKPETWTKMGAGMIGASFGQALITGNPLSVLGLLIGVAMIVVGLTAGAVKAGLKAPKNYGAEEIGKALPLQLKDIPEAALTGFIMGVLCGAITNTIEKQSLSNNIKINSKTTEQQWNNRFNDMQNSQRTNGGFQNNPSLQSSSSKAMPGSQLTSVNIWEPMELGSKEIYKFLKNQSFTPNTAKTFVGTAAAVKI